MAESPMANNVTPSLDPTSQKTEWFLALVLFSICSVKPLCAEVSHRYDGGAYFLSNKTNTGLSENSSEFIQLHQYTLGLSTSPTSNMKIKSNLSLFFFTTNGKRSFSYSSLSLRESFSRSEHALFRLVYSENTDLMFDTNETYLSLFGGPGLFKIGRFPLNFSRMFFFSPNNIFSPPTALDRLTGTKPGVDGLSYEMSLSNRITMTTGLLAGWRYPDTNAEASDETTGSEITINSDSDEEPAKRTEFEAKLSSAFVNLNTSIHNGPVVDLLLAKYAYFTLIGGSLQSQAFKRMGLRMEGNFRMAQEPFEKNSADFAVGFETKPGRTTLIQGEYFYHGAGGDKPSNYLDSQSTLRLNNRNYLGKHYTSFYAQKQMYSYLSFDSLTLLNLGDFSLLETLSLVRALNQKFEMAGRLSLPLLGESPSSSGIGSEFQLYPTTVTVELHASF